MGAGVTDPAGSAGAPDVLVAVATAVPGGMSDTVGGPPIGDGALVDCVAGWLSAIDGPVDVDVDVASPGGGGAGGGGSGRVAASLRAGRLRGAALDGVSLGGCSCEDPTLEDATVKGSALGGALPGRAAFEDAALEGVPCCEGTLKDVPPDGAALEDGPFDAAALEDVPLGGTTVGATTAGRAPLGDAPLDCAPGATSFAAAAAGSKISTTSRSPSQYTRVVVPGSNVRSTRPASAVTVATLCGGWAGGAMFTSLANRSVS